MMMLMMMLMVNIITYRPAQSYTEEVRPRGQDTHTCKKG